MSLFTAFFLAACGGGGGGDAAAPAPVPEVTTAAASSISVDNAVLNGSVNPSGLATTYHFEWGTSPTLATYDNTSSKSAGLGTAAVAVSDPITGLTQATTYYFRLAASNSAGTTKGSIVSLTTASPLDPPTVQTNAADNITVTGATLHASVIPNGLSTTAYFEWGTDNTFAVPFVTPTQSVGSDTTSHQVNAFLPGLTTGTIYYFRVVASNSAGTSRGLTGNFTTNTLAPTVTNVAASPVGTDNATLRGTVNPNGLATTYHFEWGTSSTLATYDNTPTLSAGSGTADVPVSALISPLSEATTYYFRVVATNATGTSQGTPIRFFNTLSNPPPVAVAHYNETIYTKGPGTDNSTFGATVVTLLGFDSYDLYGTITSYLWEKIAGTNSPTIADPTAIDTTFTAPALAYGATDNLVYQLTVTDNRLLTGTDNIYKYVKWGYFDDFSTNTTGAYQVFDTWGTGGTFSYDTPGQRAQVVAGDNVGIKFLKFIPISNTGVFSFDFNPTSQVDNGALNVRLNDGGAYLEISTEDGMVRKVWPAQPVDEAAFPFVYSQGSTYHVTITFSPELTTFAVTGGPGVPPAPVSLVTNTNSLSPIYLEINSTQQSSYFDNIKLEAAP
jgi:hypothetical protein